MASERSRARALHWLVELLGGGLGCALAALLVSLVEVPRDLLRNADLLRERRIVRGSGHRAGLLRRRGWHGQPLTPKVGVTGTRWRGSGGGIAVFTCGNTGARKLAASACCF